MRTNYIIMRFCVLLADSALLLAAAASPAAETITLRDCLLSLDEKADVAAQEAGVLMKVLVRDGQQVAKGEPLAQIDDVVPQMQRNVAAFKLDVAKRQAADDVDVEYAKLGAQVAQVKYDKSLEANRRHPGVVVDVDVNEQRLERDKFLLMIKKATKDLEVARLQVQVSDAELQAAEANLKRRQILAPLDAVVLALDRHEGEWVQAGDTVMKLLRVDRLRVEGYLNAKNHLPSEIHGRHVDIVVQFAREKRETFPGKIVFVSPAIQAGGNFLVRAEVENRQQNGFWVLSPGLPAEMTIQLK